MIYLISYDHTQTEFNPSDIHKTITTVVRTTDWWHYLPNVYIVTTPLFVYSRQIANTIRTAHNGLKFFIVRVDLSDHNGVLNKDAWDWINKKTNTTPRLKIVKPVLPTTIVGAAQRYIKLKAAPTNTNYTQEAIRRALNELLGKK